ncbi:hypothetical protein CsatA_025314 [Cannabis sativa]
MAFVVRVLAVLVLVLKLSMAAVYKVGDSSGWTTIEFEYNAQFHNVMRVTHAMYKTCNASLPLETYTTGNDSITITTRGHHFYMCGVPGHCQGGQKVDINVPRTPSADVAPTPLVSVSPPAPAVKAPAPASNVANSKKSHSVLLGLAGAVLFVVFGSSMILA